MRYFTTIWNNSKEVKSIKCLKRSFENYASWYSKKSVIVNQGQSVNCLYFIVKGLIEYTYINEEGTEELVEVLINILN